MYRWFRGIAVGFAVLATASATGASPDGNALRALGVEARLDPTVRDARLQELARHLQELPREEVLTRQNDFQYALMLNTDPEIYDTLAPETIEAIDNSLEGLFTFEDIDRDNLWEPLIYVYGFYNRDVTIAEIAQVLEKWESLSDSEKGPRYPTYIHVIDAVCKPISMGPMGDDDATREMLTLVLPALKTQFLQPPAPGTAFHPPSHACLILGPLYERWVDHEDYAALIEEHLGTRAEFEGMLASQLPGGLSTGPPPSHMAYGYYAYIGGYLANTLARLDARSAVLPLKHSLEIYEKQNEQGRAVAYTRRALLALGEPKSREAFEIRCSDPAQVDDCIKTAAWLARNGKNETRAYGKNVLRRLLDCPPEKALETWLRREGGLLAP